MKAGFLARVSVAAAVALAACGDSQSDAEQIRSSARTFVEGFRTQDAEAVCGAITERSQLQIVEEGLGSGVDCVEVLSGVFANAPVQNFARRTEFRKTRQTGNHATVMATSPALAPGQRTVIKLVKIDGVWKVDIPTGGVEPPD